MDKDEYGAYLKSAMWRNTREKCLSRNGHRCFICGCTALLRRLDVHHLHYKTVGREGADDLVPLCEWHHKIIHEQPEGYGLSVVERLKSECIETHWNEPLPTGPKKFRGKFYANAAELIDRINNGEMIDNADVRQAQMEEKINEHADFSTKWSSAFDIFAFKKRKLDKCLKTPNLRAS